MLKLKAESYLYLLCSSTIYGKGSVYPNKPSNLIRSLLEETVLNLDKELVAEQLRNVLGSTALHIGASKT